jgi:hypothetical protein
VDELWQEICFILHGSISTSITEEMYEQKIIQSLEKLGWSQFRKEIILKQNYQLGSVGRIIPDIIVKLLDNNESFVIEVKKPSADIENSSHKNQLFSYMRHLKLEFGLLIGSKIQIYYDGKSNPTEEPILLKGIDFLNSNKDGLLFIELFQKKSFSYQKLEIFAEKRVKELATKYHKKKLLKLLLSEDYRQKILQFITDDLEQNWDKETISDILNELSISISTVSKIPPNKLLTVEQTTQGMKIGQLVRSSMNQIISICEHSPNEIKNLESSTYSKATFNINYLFLKKVSSNAPKQEKYWKGKYKINNEYYVVTSEWYKGSIPLFEAYIAKMS